MKRQRLLFIFPSAVLLLCCSAALVSAFTLPDTGQTKCYNTSGTEIACAGTGQDGAYNINPMSYTDNGNGTITDNVTGLIWQKGENPTYYNWYQASGTNNATYNPSSQNVCGSLTLGGQSGWRLPTEKELVGLVDYSISDPGLTTINTTYFPNTQASSYWASTTSAVNTDLAWYVYFGYGFVGYGGCKCSSAYVRCVRGGQSSPSFTNNGNGTVTDNGTGLMWQQGEPGSMTWSGALSYCEGLSLGGQTDWRLPNIKELESITDVTKYNPAIDTTYFPNATANVYWSSTTWAFYTPIALYVGFYDGIVNYNGGGKLASYYVRCVRTGQSGSLCNLTISPSSQTFTSSGGTSSVSVTASSSSCAWTSTSSLGWVTINSGAGRGSGTATFSVSANPLGSGQRTGNITIAGQTFVITQLDTVFADVAPTNVFYNYINAIYNAGITVGCSQNPLMYCPDDSVTRGQMAAFIIRAKYGETFTYTQTPYFSDVPATNGFFKYVQKMKDTGITTVTGTYYVDASVTRGQMAAFIIRAKYGETFTYTQTPYFSDVPATNGFFKYVQMMKDTGITAVTGTYGVNDTVTRGQMAAFIARAFLSMP